MKNDFKLDFLKLRATQKKVMINKLKADLANKKGKILDSTYSKRKDFLDWCMENS